MTAKRFTMCHEQNDLNGWTMSIVDWKTKEPFDYTTYEVHSSSITDTKDEMEDLCLLLNELHEENTTLKSSNMEMEDYLGRIEEEIKELKEIGDYQNNRIKELNQQLESEHQMLDNAILLERTRMGKNSLKQYKESIQ